MNRTGATDHQSGRKQHRPIKQGSIDQSSNQAIAARSGGCRRSRAMHGPAAVQPLSSGVSRRPCGGGSTQSPSCRHGASPPAGVCGREGWRRVQRREAAQCMQASGATAREPAHARLPARLRVDGCTRKRSLPDVNGCPALLPTRRRQLPPLALAPRRLLPKAPAASPLAPHPLHTALLVLRPPKALAHVRSSPRGIGGEQAGERAQAHGRWGGSAHEQLQHSCQRGGMHLQGCMTSGLLTRLHTQARL